MKERIITGLILAIITLSCVFATRHIMPILIFMLILSGIASYEWFRLMPQKASNQDSKPSQKDAYIYGIIGAWVSGLMMMTCSIGYIGEGFAILKYLLAVVVVYWLVSIYWVYTYPNNNWQWYNQSLYVAGIILISSACFSMFFLWIMSPWWLMYVFLLVWGMDTGAYFFGRQFGKTKLSVVSPNKSIEGLIGGIVTTIFIIGIASLFSSLSLTFMQWIFFIFISILTVLISVQGDLFESMIKRCAGKKDSGHILPGHGGVLDRVDSLLSAMPFFLCGLYLLSLMGVVL